MGLFSKKQIVVGFDLSDISMKIMQLEKASTGYKIVGYTDQDLAKGIMVNDVIMNEKEMVKQINRAFNAPQFGKVTSRNVVASIPESKAFVRVMQIPKMTEEQAANAVPFEAEQYIPMPLDQVYLDWQIIGEKEGKMDVLVSACPKDYVDNLLRIMKLAGLQPVAFEVESAACARALVSPDKKDKAILIMDMDTYRTSLINVEDGYLKFTSSVPIAGEAFSQSIASARNISLEDAEIIKRTVGLDDSRAYQDVKAALAEVIDRLILEVLSNIRFHDEHSPKPIGQIILCGGSAKLLHLNSYLYQKLSQYSQIDILLGNPWANVFDASRPNQTSLTREDSLAYTTVIGLALRAVEL